MSVELEDAPVMEAKRTPSVLLVEDDTELSSAIADYLSKNGFAVSTEARGDRAVERITVEQPDMVVLDVMLPGRDGFDICRDVRSAGNRVPIIMLTARDEDFDQVLGLELGADDYLAKPVQPRVLLARIKAVGRRLTPTDDAPVEENILRFGRLRIHGGNRDATIGETRIKLTPAEFDLLWLLASNAGKVMHRDDILKELRGLDYNGADRSVDARLYRLRRRFGDEKESAWKIKTVRPHGYMFCVDPW
jgi:two-component system OmpR family response regulator/two-component system response regulator RstA